MRSRGCWWKGRIISEWTKGALAVILVGCIVGLAGPARAACVAEGRCPGSVEVPDDDIDNDQDGIELRSVYQDAGDDSSLGPFNELLSFSAGWSSTELAFGFDFSLETNAMIWYIELSIEGGETDFLGPEEGTYEGAYPANVQFSEGMDLMAATAGTSPLELYRTLDNDSLDNVLPGYRACLTENCDTGGQAFGFVRVGWSELYGPAANPVPPGAQLRVAGIIRAEGNDLPADIAPDNDGGIITRYIVLNIDSDHDGIPDQAFFEDRDGDGTSPHLGDCDDADPVRYPGADEVCDGIDNDCDGQVEPSEQDADKDGYRGCDGDCDDQVSYAHPGADEVCDGALGRPATDNDCDGEVDEGFDVDGVGGADCEDDDLDGYTEDEGDCDDGDPYVSPGADEVCDAAPDAAGIDNDCDGEVDEGFDLDGSGGIDCVDDDGDGFSELGGDCQDDDPSRSPGLEEVCDGVDNDCDGEVDEGFDQDGIGGPDCQDFDGDGYSEMDGDCNDGDAAQSPSAPEVCDGIDNNCKDGTDEGFDADGVGGADCIDNDGDGETEDDGDCSDANPSLYAGATELCDGLDNDCDNEVDEGFDKDGAGGSDCIDHDGDGVSEDAGDCDDVDVARYPGATEVCNGEDDDCDDEVDEGFDDDGLGGPDCTDDDLDGWSETEGDCDDSDPMLSPGAAEVGGNLTDENCDGVATDQDGDGFLETSSCDDHNPAIYPGATDICDELDNDCDGYADEGTLEVCDGLDNDCDGVVDEGVPEVCDGVDNDCDGEVDEGLRTLPGSGVCVTTPGYGCACSSPSTKEGGGQKSLWFMTSVALLGAGLRSRTRRSQRTRSPQRRGYRY